jgi:hypothetical protein
MFASSTTLCPCRSQYKLGVIDDKLVQASLPLQLEAMKENHKIINDIVIEKYLIDLI